MIDLYDLEKLEKAQKIIDEVYGYNFGASDNRKVVSRLETISHKLDEVIAIIKKDR